MFSRFTVSRHLVSLGYKNTLPLSTPMLTQAHKQKRVEWAQKHKDDNWRKTLFSDETSFQLFRNTLKHWYKNARPIRRMPKDRSKIFARGGFCVKGKTSLFCFRCIMDGKFYTEILEKHIPEVRSMFRGNWRSDRTMTLSILAVLLGNFLITMSRRLWIGLLIVRT
jgi:hypothetical protein